MRFTTPLCLVIPIAFALSSCAPPPPPQQQAQLQVSQGKITLGPGTCVEVRAIPPRAPQPNTLSVSLDLSAQGKAAMNQKCVADGGTVLGAGCPRSKIATDCSRFNANTQTLLIAYQGSPSIDNVAAACGMGGKGSGGGGGRGGIGQAEPIDAIGDFFTACKQ